MNRKISVQELLTYLTILLTGFQSYTNFTKLFSPWIFQSFSLQRHVFGKQPQQQQQQPQKFYPLQQQHQRKINRFTHNMLQQHDFLHHLNSRSILKTNHLKKNIQEAPNQNTRIFTTWSVWSEWSKCSKSCSGGARTRTRVCTRWVPIYSNQQFILHCG